MKITKAQALAQAQKASTITRSEQDGQLIEKVVSFDEMKAELTGRWWSDQNNNTIYINKVGFCFSFEVVEA
jgi:hypothetical protein